MYKTKQEAINAIQENDSDEEFYDYELFKSKEFDLFRDDKEVVLTAVQNSSYAIQYCSERLRDDKEIVLAAVNNNGSAIQYCSERLKDDKEFALAAVSKNGRALEFCSDRLKNDKDIALSLNYQNDLFCFKNVSDELKNDREFIFKVVEKNPYNLESISDRLKNDKELIIHALSSNNDFQNKAAYIYPNCSSELQKDRDIVLSVLKDSSSLDIFSASPRSNLTKILENNFTDDKEIMLRTIDLDPYFIEICSDRLKNDKEIVLNTIKNNDRLLRHASDEIKNLCQDKNPTEILEALTKAIETEKLHEQLQKEIKPRDLDFAKALSTECKQATMEQSQQVAKPKMKMKL